VDDGRSDGRVSEALARDLYGLAHKPPAHRKPERSLLSAPQPV
jgi:hypothetical protein